MKYEYHIDLDERGEFRADVRKPSGKTVFDIEGPDIFDDGFMSNKNDTTGLTAYLKDRRILKPGDSIERAYLSGRCGKRRRKSSKRPGRHAGRAAGRKMAGRKKSFVVGGETVHIDIQSHNVKGKGVKAMSGKRRKRRVSQKTLDALRRGREKLAAKRKKLHGGGRKRRATSSPIQRTGTMARRKARRVSRRRRVSGFEGFSGFEGGRRRRRRARRVSGLAGGRRRSRRRRHSGGLLMGGGRGMGAMKAAIMPVVLGIAGGAGAAILAGKLPATLPPMARAGIPLAAGIGLAGFMKNPMLKAVGMGMAIVGGYALARQALPNVMPALSGIDELSAEDFPLTGADVQALGDVQQLGLEDFSGAEPGEFSGEDVYSGEDMEGADDMDGTDDMDGQGDVYSGSMEAI